jgi:hypothetical protein
MITPSLYEFQQWHIEKQTEWVTEKGRYLSWRAEGEYNIYLYHVEEFFAETWMHVRMGKVLKITCSKIDRLPGGYDQSVLLK